MIAPVKSAVTTTIGQRLDRHLVEVAEQLVAVERSRGDARRIAAKRTAIPPTVAARSRKAPPTAPNGAAMREGAWGEVCADNVGDASTQAARYGIAVSRTSSPAMTTASRATSAAVQATASSTPRRLRRVRRKWSGTQSGEKYTTADPSRRRWPGALALLLAHALLVPGEERAHRGPRDDDLGHAERQTISPRRSARAARAALR